MKGPAKVMVAGGIGGLSAAIALRRAGFEVVVLERAPELRPATGTSAPTCFEGWDLRWPSSAS